MITLTIGSDRRITADSRAMGSAVEDVVIHGLPETATADNLRLYLVCAQGVVVAYATDFVQDGNAVFGQINLNTTAMESALAYAVMGRMYRFDTVVTDNDSTVYGSGTLHVVKTPQIVAPVQLGAATIAEIKAILNALGGSEEPDNEHELWEKTRQAASDVAERL